jgi:hypothetical protein
VSEDASGSGILRAQRAVWRSGLTTIEKVVLLAILDHWSAKGPEPWPALARLEQWTGLGRSTIKRALRGLTQRGALGIRETRGGVNHYDLSALFRGDLPGPERTGVQSGPGSRAGRDPVQSGPGPGPERTPKGSKKESNEGTQGSASLSSASSFALEPSDSMKPKPRSRKPKAPTENGKAHAEVVDCYHAEYSAKHGKAPIIGAREGAAVKLLLEKLRGDAPEACQRVRNAFASFRADSVTIGAIASNPDAFASAAQPRNGGKGPSVQRGLAPRVKINDRPAWLGG